MKNLAIKTILVLNCFFASQSRSAEAPEVRAKLQKLTSHFMQELKGKNGEKYWEGQQELHPVWDLLLYVALKKTDSAPPTLEAETLKRLFSWKIKEGADKGAWPLVPGAIADFDSTAAILVTLEKALGIPRSDPRVSAGWSWLDQKHNFSGDKDIFQLNVLFRIFLTVVGVIPRSVLPPFVVPPFPVKLLGMPKDYPMSPVDMGIFRTVMVPLVVWDFYTSPFGFDVTALNDERLHSQGREFGKLNVDSKILGPLIKSVNELMVAIGGDSWESFAAFIDNVINPLEDRNKWAQEGLSYIISRKQRGLDAKGSTWYVLGSSLVSLMALDAASKSVVTGNSSTPIDAQSTIKLRDLIVEEAKGLLAWRQLGNDTNGIHFIPAARSNIWDSSLALQNLSSLPADLHEENLSAIKDVTQWLSEGAVTQKGDWTWWREPEEQLADNSFVAWSFYPEAVWHPDTDDSASVLESLMKVTFSDASAESNRQAQLKKGLHWILSQQNDDGGFPAWESGTSKLTNDLMQQLLAGMPRVSDFSQVDVSSRILRMLLNARKVPALGSPGLEDAIKSNCHYLKNAREDTKVANTPLLWEGDWIVDYTYGTAEAISSLLEAGESYASCWNLDSSTPYLEWFKSIQNSDHGWGESQASYKLRSYVAGKSTVLQSTYVLKAFIAYEKLYRKTNSNAASPFYPTLKSGVDFLLSQVQADGGIQEKSFTGVYIKDFIFSDYTLMPEYHTIGVLGEALKF